MQKFFWYVLIVVLGLFVLRAPSLISIGLFSSALLLATFAGAFKKLPTDPHNKIRKQAKRISEITYKATINIPKEKFGLIEKLLYIDRLYRKKKIKKAEATYYKHILPKLVALQEKQLAIAEIPGQQGLLAKQDFEPKMEQAYTAVESWCDHRIKAYSKHLQLDSDIDTEVIVSLSKYL
ncbi:MAG: hypothetical protein HKN88_00170 [Gammaproteobacteria bacterium]|nr:hypothetical protein [Gammaproteobacteria bacterium]NNC96464.1 hypothetical protein [Gammaproteobacteria bacterium]NNM14513.1 hypothetical protein [Gammaproteobacteria bacterium]